MKTRIIIDIETDNLKPVYKDEDLEEKCTEELDEAVHKSIEKSIEYFINETDTLSEDFFNDLDGEPVPDEYESFDDIGEIKISISKEVLDKETHEVKSDVN